MNTVRVVIIGGDAAGMSAASKIRRVQPERDILVLERTPHTSYSACGMPYAIAGQVEDFSRLIARSPEEFRDKYGIDVRTSHEVIAIEPAPQRIRIRTPEGKVISEPYDQLLIATGARPFCPDLPGDDARGIFGLSTLESGLRIQQFIDRLLPRRAVIVGGGYIGLEMAEALLCRGLETSLVQRGPQVMDSLDPDMGALVSAALWNSGVTLYTGEACQGFEAENGRVCAVVTDRRTLPADIVILGMGVRPRSELAEQAGLKLEVKQAIWTDARMRTSQPNIWAAGDCVASRHRLSGEKVHIALGTIANKQGLVAGTNIAGTALEFPGVVGTAVSKICKVEIARSGLQEKELKKLGWDFASATVKTRTRAGYYPGADTIHVKLLGQKGSGRLVGAQIVGGEGAAKRIDTLATAMTAGLSVTEIVDLDLSYAPPFSPVWDPVQTAARQLLKAL